MRDQNGNQLTQPNCPVLRRTRAEPVRGFTLFELLLTVTIIGILAAAMVPLLCSSAADRLTTVAQIIASDLEVARNLAVTNQSQYRLVFTPGSQQYYLEHSGTNPLLQTLPASPFHYGSEQLTRHTTDLAEAGGNGVIVLGIERGGVFSGTVNFSVEFTELGSTTLTTVPSIWLSTGQGIEERYLPLRVNPTTGIVDIGEFTAHDPRGTPVAQFTLVGGQLR